MHERVGRRGARPSPGALTQDLISMQACSSMVTRHMTVTVVPNSQMSTDVSWYTCEHGERRPSDQQRRLYALR